MNRYEENNKLNRAHVILLMLFFAALILSVIKPKSYLTWILEAFPIFIGILILIFTYKKFQFTTFVYALILIQIILILIGAHYTYGEVPLFNWIKKAYGLNRNHYDRLVHFIQGFISAFIIRELLVRKLKLKKGIILSLLVVCICLSLSAFYELIEWGVALIAGEKANDFLGFQGDIWDTQWDMFWGLIGSIISVSSFYRIHDRYIDKLEKHH
jgi:putative membrane protein